MSATDVRRAFLEFFREQGHTIVPSSPLVPANDPTLLFTNAGMVQFKDVFLGKDKRDYVRATSSQRCVRAGGKHNDLENVGYTARHHTFFEMLGNFSFGDYFKRDAIRFAWDFVTGVLRLDPQRLWVTVYRDDDEAARIWLEDVGVPPERLTRLGEASNFWAMGDTGPCGPCSEIFWDHGPEIPGGPPGSPDEDGDRFVEIWNLVFMQFERAADGTLTPLPKPSVDTGAGLERLSAVMQSVHNNYQIDLFQDLVAAAAALAGTRDFANPSLRVIADHIRACSFLVVDGVLPSNEGRGYVLRRIIRRAIRHGHKLGIEGSFFYKLVAPLERQMGAAYPELSRGRAQVEKVLRQEEERFAETLAKGMELLEGAIAALPAQISPQPASVAETGAATRVIDGETVFKLYDTYGFPVDLTADVARERGLGIDQAGFEAAMAAQRERARAASRFGVDQRAVQLDVHSRFDGYGQTQGEGRVIALLADGQRVAALQPGERGEIVLDRTPFYAESGGQVGDVGELSADGACFVVEDTQKRGIGAAHAHIGRVAETSTPIREGQVLQARVDARRRGATAANHSATHLLHAALRAVLGTHVQQKGSLVSPERLRFDFAHFQAVTPEELRRIEHLVNEQVRVNALAETREMDYDTAVASGAMALFGEKYDATVRVLRLGDFSTELCGGTHVARAGDIGFFKIVSEGGVAAGVRRIEAVTGQGALEFAEASEYALREITAVVRGTREDVAAKVRDALERIRQLEKENRALKDKLASGQGTDLAAGATEVAGTWVVATKLEGADAGALRNAVDQLKERLKTAVIVLASVESNGKVLLVAGVTADRSSQIKAGELVGRIASLVGGRGGGRADFAQAGGTDAARLDEALAEVLPFVRAKL
ncbi:MAG: alanine--tRNA ligase [Sinobacteraceae bacterium]|nr:alanine--tRNA ligase [Nevskiaceae bacterium]MCP5340104.1 alanine--tRNA ligase [Nevskiaceae bacterium]MCP5359285.1 alanine--tRNA ligase [Nevskiaceae bacterium]MCP5466514.1 alanine--tRNA ligase [Nevskiaceae bacterium]